MSAFFRSTQAHSTFNLGLRTEKGEETDHTDGTREEHWSDRLFWEPTDRDACLNAADQTVSTHTCNETVLPGDGRHVMAVDIALEVKGFSRLKV